MSETIRDWSQIDHYYSKLLESIYKQPEDSGHTDWTEDALDRVFTLYKDRVNSILDVGCGTGFVQDLVSCRYEGITLGKHDYQDAKKNERNVKRGDIHYLPQGNGSVDMVLARHVLEHSPMPLIALMEWWRVSQKYLFLIAPAPEYWDVYGRNHFSVLYKDQIYWLLQLSGWEILVEQDFKTSDISFKKHYANNTKRITEGKPMIDVPGVPKVVEYRFFCEKTIPRVE